MSQQTPKKRVLFVHSLWLALLVLFGVFSMLALTLRSPKVAEAATSNTINFQARLQTAAGGIVPDGNYNVEFRLYSAASGGSALWTEDYLNSAGQGLPTRNGYLTANLGSLTAFSGINWDQQLWLTMNIGGTVTTGTFPSIGDGEMNPRLPLTAVPYAFSAGQLNNTAAGGRSSLNFQGSASGHGDQNFVLQDQGAAGTYNLLTTTQADAGYIQNQTAATQVAGFNINGTGTIGTLNATTALQTAGVTRIDDSGNLSNIGNISGTGTLQLSGTTGTSYIMSALGLGTTNPQSGAALTVANNSWISGIDSSGTGYINMFQLNSSNEIQVGAALNIDGGIVLPTDAGQVTFADLPISTSATAGSAMSYTFRIGSSNVLTVYGEADGSGNLQNGRIAVGSSITPQYPLDVTGDINTSTGYRVGGTAGATTTCSGGQFLQNPTIAGGIVTAGACASAAAGLTGSGTDGTIAMFSGSGTNLGNSILTQSGSDTLNVGGRLNIQGATGNFSWLMQMAGTLNSSYTGAQFGFDNEMNFNPTGASVGDIYGLVNNPTISGSALAINNYFGQSTGIATASGYTGQITNGYGINVTSPNLGGSKKITNYYGINVSGNSANGSNTSGTLTNTQVKVGGITAGAGSGGTVTNYGILLTQPSGTGGTTNNYGLYIQGNGGGSTNYAIYSTSTAASLLSGSLQATTVNATSGYQLNGTAGATTTCTGGQFLQNQVVQGGITTGGTCASAAAGLTGSGTDGTIAMFSGSGTNLGNSILTQSSGTITVAGNLTATGTITAAGAAITGTTTINTSGSSNTTIGNSSSTTTVNGAFVTGGNFNLGNYVFATPTCPFGCSVTMQGSPSGASPGGPNIKIENNSSDNDIALNGAVYLTGDANHYGRGALTVYAGYANATSPTEIIQQGATPTATADMLQLQNSSAAVYGGFNYQGNLYYKNGSYTNTINTATLTANQTITLPNASGTVALTNDTTNFIRNQSSQQTSANFNIDGTGVANILQAGTFDAASSSTLNIGTTNASGITIGSQNILTTIPGPVSINGNSTGGLNTKLNVSGTLNSSYTGFQYGIQNSVNFNPQGASVAAIVGFTGLANVSGSSLAVPSLTGASYGISTGAGYTGQVANGVGLSINGPIIGGSQLIPAYYGAYILQNANNGGNTSGTILNEQLKIGGITAGAGTGGTLNNYGIYLSQPSGSGGTTNNYGLYITGAGGGTSNYSIYNNSSALSYLTGSLTSAGTVQAATVNATSGYQLNGTAGATTTCSGGQFLQNQVVQGGITTGGTCASAAAGLTGSGTDGTIAMFSGSGTNLGNSILTQSGGAITVGGSATITGNLTVQGTGTNAFTGSIDAGAGVSTSINGVRTYENVYSKGTSGAVTGTLEIILPAQNNSMLNFTIKGYDYTGTTGTWQVNMSGFLYTNNTWLYSTAQMSGNAPFTSVRLAYNSTLGQPVLLLGTTGTVWAYPQVSVTQVVAGYANQDVWGKGYTSSFITSETGITSITSPAVPRVATSANAFLQGGNSFGATAVIGTNDSNSVSIVTGGVSQLTIDTSGNATLTGSFSSGSTINAVSGFKYNGTAGSSTSCTGGYVLQNATVSGGIITGGTCVANGGGIAPTLQDVYNNSTNPATITLTSTNHGITIQDASTTVGGNLFAVQSNGGATKYLTVTTSGATVAGTLTVSTAIQTPSIDSISGSLTVGASASSIIFGSSTNGITFTAAGGLVASGTAQHGKSIVLPAEYAGAVLDAQSDSSCSSANSGTMTSGFDSTNRMNYYNWTATGTTTQCYDVVVQVQIPKDWSSWDGSDPLNIQTKSSGTSNTAVSFQILNASGTADSNYNFGTFSQSTSWMDSASSNFSGTYAAGDVITIKIRMSAKNSANLQIGTITLNYNSKY